MLLNCGVGEDSWTARISNQSILKEINPEYSWEGLMLKLKLVGVQPRWIQGDSKVGTASASLENYIFNYRYRERLETDSVVGKLVEIKRLNNLVYME